MDRTISRRALLLGTAAAAVAPALWTPRAARASLGRTLALAAKPEGTTLLEAIERPPGGGYVRLAPGPGWPTITRSELGAPRQGREDRRRAVAAFVQLTDTHLIDAESPGRVEFVDRYASPFESAYRHQDALTVQVLGAMVTTLGRVRHGPITGRPLDAAVSTGDNIDNCQRNELEWFIASLDGGSVAPTSGDPSRYEGVQDSIDTWPGYWHPGTPGVDDPSTAGFPEIPGLLEAAIAPVTSPGLEFPWYSTYGNHDGLLQGNLPVSTAVDAVLTGSIKVTDLQPGQSAVAFVVSMLSDAPGTAAEILSGAYPHRVVTADPSRRSVSTRDWIELHLASPSTPGPKGHGYTEDHLEQPGAWYAFDLAPGVRGVSLDTGGYNSGSIGQTQFDWLQRELVACHGRYFDEAGTEIRTGSTDQLVVVFSHFNPRSMGGSLPDPAHPDERRILGPELVDLLHRFPNVVAWVNGHHHVNEVTPQPDPSGRAAGFWDVNTASHIDFPSHARILELVDNRDGTLSIFTTMLDHAGPVAPNYDDPSVLALAGLSRELAANDPQKDPYRAAGLPTDRNVELVLPAPFDLTGLGEPSTPTTSIPTTSTTSPTTTSSTATAAARTPTFTG